MSLLLDALKKAAEQKAQKNEPEQPAEQSSDETLLDVADEVAARPQQSDGKLRDEDETEFEHAELSARLERSSVVRGAADETALDLAGATETRHQYSESTSPAGDETGLDVPETTETHIGQEQARVTQGEDTGLDLAEATQTGFKQHPRQRSGADETVIDVVEASDAASGKADKSNLSEQLQTGDDETIIFSSDDATNFVVEQEALDRQPAQEDETDLGQPGGEDLTGIGTGKPVTGDTHVADDEETDLGQLANAGDLTGISDLAGESSAVGDTAKEDETDLGHSEPEVEPREVEPRDVVDETDISLAQPGNDATDGDDAKLAQSREDEGSTDVRQAVPDADETDISQPMTRADQVEPADAELRQADAGELGDNELGDEDPTNERVDSEAKSTVNVSDEDLSLLLLEPDPTSPRAAADTSFTDPQIVSDRKRAIDEGWSELDALGLVDQTQSRADRDQTDTEGATLTNPSLTAIQGNDTRTAQGAETASRVTRAEATSTHTYAPDNYDRTLMKLPSDDESKLFAGLKSDSDVVMTPDYAKKVFRSKTSAQRVQHYKIYLGIATVIVLAIGIYGIMQYNEESLAIDSSLRPLKRDPMPGLIKPPKVEETNLFAGTDSESTARTIEIIEAAETAESVETGAVDSAGDATLTTPEVADTAAQVQPVTQAPTTAPLTTGGTSEAVVAAAAVQPRVEPQSQPQAIPLPRADPPASAASQQPAAAASTEPASNLQIKSSSQYRQNDIWLREAYAAYLAGNDAQALGLYNQVLAADPGNRNALLARAAINTQNGNFSAAIKDYQSLLLANPKDSMAMSSLLAVANYSPQESESQLKLMIHEEPESPYLNFALANAYGAQNRWLEAQRHYFRALQSSPQDPNYAYNLAVSLEHISQSESAATYYRRALDNFDNGLATFNRDIVNQRLEVLGKP